MRAYFLVLIIVRCQYLGKLGILYENSVLFLQLFKKYEIISKWKVKNEKTINKNKSTNRRGNENRVGCDNEGRKNRGREAKRTWLPGSQRLHLLSGFPRTCSSDTGAGSSAYVLGGNIHWGTKEEGSRLIEPHLIFLKGLKFQLLTLSPKTLHNQSMYSVRRKCSLYVNVSNTPPPW